MVEPIPADVASAISAVMAGVRTLGKDDHNQHQNYDFVSTNKFLAAVNPLCAAAGLIIVQDEESVDIRTIESADRYGNPKKGSWLIAKYSFILAHKDGATWGPVYRSVMVQANGAQAFGSAQSYSLKQFMRSLFQISTGDKDDADLQAEDPLPDKQHANQQRKPANQPEVDDKAITASFFQAKTLREFAAAWSQHEAAMKLLPKAKHDAVIEVADQRTKDLVEAGIKAVKSVDGPDGLTAFYELSKEWIKPLSEDVRTDLVKRFGLRKAELMKVDEHPQAAE